MLREVFRIHGFPSDIVSDRGPQFISQFWRAFCQLLGASVSLSSGFHPQSNGQTERVNQELEKFLRCFVSSHSGDWSNCLSWAELAHNTLQNSSTGMSPFQCQFGFQPPYFPEQEPEFGVPSAQHLVRCCQRVWNAARATLTQSSRRQQQAANRRLRPIRLYHPGQRVWLSTKDLPLRMESRKLTPRFIDPFKVADASIQ